MYISSLPRLIAQTWAEQLDATIKSFGVDWFLTVTIGCLEVAFFSCLRGCWQDSLVDWMKHPLSVPLPVGYFVTALSLLTIYFYRSSQKYGGEGSSDTPMWCHVWHFFMLGGIGWFLISDAQSAQWAKDWLTWQAGGGWLLAVAIKGVIS